MALAVGAPTGAIVACIVLPLCCPIALADTAQVNALTEAEATRSKAFAGAGASLGHDPTLVWLNPAAGAGTPRVHVTAGGNLGMFDESGGQALLVLPVRSGAVMAGAYYNDAGDAELNTSAGTTVRLNLQRDALGMVGFAGSLGESLNLGGSLKMLRSVLLDDYTTVAIACDLGLQARLSKWVKLGAVVRNAGTRVRYLEDSIPSPATMLLGLAVGTRLPNGHAVLGMADMEYLHVEENMAWKIGLEYQIAGIVALRAGLHQSDHEAIRAYAAGIGLMTNLCRLDYSIRTGTEFTLPQSFSLTIAFK